MNVDVFRSSLEIALLFDGHCDPLFAMPLTSVEARTDTTLSAPMPYCLSEDFSPRSDIMSTNPRLFIF